MSAAEKMAESYTSDNGCEFARHEEVSKELNADFFFAHPYSSWERVLNENTNGLIRQYLKKGSELTKVTNQDLAIIENKLNNRPRKTLGYKSSNEVFKKE
jgi:IS30 family transposase